MKKDDVKVGGTYSVKVGEQVVPVKITEEKWTGDKHTGWAGVNTLTNRAVRIKSAQRLRGLVEGEAAAHADTKKSPEGAAKGKAKGAGVVKPGKAAKAPKPPKPAKEKKMSGLD